MKNIINLPLLEKLNFINLFAYQMQHPKRFQEFSLKFSIPLSFDILAVQLSFVAGNIASRLCGLIKILLLKFFDMLKAFSEDNHCFSKLVC